MDIVPLVETSVNESLRHRFERELPYLNVEWGKLRRAGYDGGFNIGDWFERVGSCGGWRRRLLIARYGELIYARFREMGRIARLWPLTQRDPSKSWSWHRDNPPGMPPREKRRWHPTYEEWVRVGKELFGKEVS